MKRGEKTAAEIARPDEADDLPNLSPWAAELRYGRAPEAAPDRGQTRTLVERTKAWSDAQLATASGREGE